MDLENQIQAYHKKESRFRPLGSLILSIPITFVMLDLHAEKELAENFISTLLSTFIYWYGNANLWWFFRQRFPESHQTTRRVALSVASLVLYATIVSTVMSYFVCEVGQYSLVNIYPDFLIGVILSFTVTTIYESIYFFNLWKFSLLEVADLKQSKLELEFKNLQNQLNPHFLFNTLNTLVALIPENSDLAVQYVQELAQLYRYVLQSKDKELVSLEAELSFAKTYLFLQKRRYEDKLKIDLELNDSTFNEQKQLPPLVLQMLIENAIKHNIISKAKPLSIEVKLENGFLCIKNNVQKKMIPYDSTHTGLENIKKRYSFFGIKDISIQADEHSFIVKLPLLSI